MRGNEWSGDQICLAAGALVHCSSFGSIRVDHRSWSSTSFSVTVITSVVAVDSDVAEELQAEAGREILALLRAAAFLKHRRGPNVLSSWPGPQVPACSGPDTNSQNGSKS